jgi:hypothetical protein
MSPFSRLKCQTPGVVTVPAVHDLDDLVHRRKREEDVRLVLQVAHLDAVARQGQEELVRGCHGARRRLLHRLDVLAREVVHRYHPDHGRKCCNGIFA